MWPTSPAEPLAPRWIRPSTTIPAPIPVPILTKTKSSTPRPQPAVSSPSAITLTSLSTHTGTPRSAKRARTAYPSQPGMIGGETGRPDSNSTGPGTPMPMPQSGAGHARLGDALVEELLDAGQHGVGAGRDVGRLLPVDDDLAREVGERDVGARRAEVGDEQVARVGAEAEQPRRPAARRDTEAILCQQPVVEQRVDPLGQHRAAEPGRLRELRPRGRAVCADVVEHGDEAVGLERDPGLCRHFGFECRHICRSRQDFS